MISTARQSTVKVALQCHYLKVSEMSSIEDWGPTDRISNWNSNLDLPSHETCKTVRTKFRVETDGRTYTHTSDRSLNLVAKTIGNRVYYTYNKVYCRKMIREYQRSWQDWCMYVCNGAFRMWKIYRPSEKGTKRTLAASAASDWRM